MTFYPVGAAVPEGLETDRVLLRPLRAADAELDYDAVMSSAASLRRWSGSDWPADDFTLEKNRADLERHEREHGARVAFTFTVLDPAAERCLGCVYLQPWPETAALPPRSAHPARAAFWVRDSEVALELDRHLLATLSAWLPSAWPFDHVVFTVAAAETRQPALMREAGLEPRPAFRLADGRTCQAFAAPAKARRAARGRALG